VNDDGSRMTRKTIVLIVEDDPLQMMMAEDLVEDAGLTSIVAGNADQAIAILESRTDIRIVLTDVDMPGSMDGLRLAEVVRDRWPPVQLVVVSGHVLVETTKLPEYSRFFNKPYSPDLMVRALKMLAL
jgi:two-component system, response regulator PdtaR